MSKKNTKKSISTHVPTHIGFGILALVVLLFGLTIVTQYNANNQTQTVDSNASTAKTPLVKPQAPAKIVVSNTKQCISYNVQEKCILYQQTTVVANTKSPCISYNVAGKCTYYKDTNPTTVTFVPTKTPPVKTPANKCQAVFKCSVWTYKYWLCASGKTVQVCN